MPCDSVSFHSDKARTFADLIARVEADGQLTKRRRTDLHSSIRSFLRHLGRDASLASDAPSIRAHLERFNPTIAGVGTKRWSNVRSDVLFVLRRYSAPRRAPLPKDLSPTWRALQDRLDDVKLKRGLSRFLHYASREGVTPEGVDDDVSARFLTFMIEESLQRRPQQIHRDTCRLWNRAAKEVPGWPAAQLTVLSYRKTTALPLDTFPVSFRDDLYRWERMVSGHDLLAQNAPDKPLRPATAQRRRLRSLLPRWSPSRRTGLALTTRISTKCVR